MGLPEAVWLAGSKGAWRCLTIERLSREGAASQWMDFRGYYKLSGINSVVSGGH